VSPIILSPYRYAAAGGGGNPNGFLFYRTVTIDHTQVGSSDASNYPLLVSATNASFKTVGNGGKLQSSSGFDRAYYSDIGLTTALTFETERWVSTMGEIIDWVVVPTVSHTVDTVIYMGYDSTTVTTDQTSAHGVWDANTQAVHHFKDGSSLSLADATSNARTLTGISSPTATTGLIDGGMNLSGSGQHADLAYSLTAPAISNMTISFWMKSASNASQVGIWSWAGVATDTSPVILIQNNSGTLQFFTDGGYRDTSSTVPLSTWCYVAVTIDTTGTIKHFYRNGVLLSSFTGAAANLNSTVFVGSGYNGQFNGVIDEHRIITATRSADWLLTDYNTQKPSQTAVTLGTETST
jgi:hypothetical protein